MVIFTLTLLAFFISLSMQMMNQLFLGQSMGVAIVAVILPLVLSLILSLIACQQYGQSRWIVVPTTLLLTLALTLFLATSLYCCYGAPPTHLIPHRPRETHVLRGRWLMGK